MEWRILNREQTSRTGNEKCERIERKFRNLPKYFVNCLLEFYYLQISAILDSSFHTDINLHDCTDSHLDYFMCICIGAMTHEISAAEKECGLTNKVHLLIQRYVHCCC